MIFNWDIFVFECITIFLEILIALVLSHSIEIGKLYSTLVYFNAFFIQRICVKNDVAKMYYASVVDKDIEYCFFLSQYTKQFPKNNAPPLVLFLSSTLPTQYASVYIVRVNYSPFGYHSPKFIVPFRYLRVILTDTTCDSFAAY